MVNPISDASALKRLGDAGLTLEQAWNLSDDVLLRYPSIGRRTLAWVREREPTPHIKLEGKLGGFQ